MVFGLIIALARCNNCNRVEFMRDAGPFLYRCDECGLFVPKELK